jgi:hypothetical protein
MLVWGAQAQFSPEFLMSQFTRVAYMRNPAAAGLTPGNNFHLFNRNDIPPVALPNNNYFAMSFDGANDSAKLGFGLLAFFNREFRYQDQANGQFAYTVGLDGSFSYITQVNAAMQFRLGGSIGARFISVPVQQVANNATGLVSRLIPSLSFGIMLATDRADAGVSAYNLTNPVVTFQGAPEVRLVESRMFLLQGSFLAYTDQNWEIRPAAALKLRQGTNRLDNMVAEGGITGTFANQILFGGGIRAGGIPFPYGIVQLGLIIRGNELVVSYDVPIGNPLANAYKFLEATFGITL